MKVFGIILLVLCSMTALAGAAYLDASCIYDRPGSYVTVVYSGDLTGSGHEEIFAGSDNGQVMDFSYSGRACISQWGPTWSHNQAPSRKGKIVDIMMRDIDNDGVNELIFAADSDEEYISVLSNQNIKWTEEKGGSIAYALDVADLDSDGTEDIVYGNKAGSVILLSAGKTVKWTTMLDASVYAVKITDLNGDGTSEVVALTIKESENTANVYAIGPDGKTLWSYLIEVGIYKASKNSISVGDVNSDGKMEIAVATRKRGVIVLDDAGTLLWEYSIDNPVTAVYIAESEGKVLAASNPNLYMLESGGSLDQKIDVGSGGLIIQTTDLSGDGSEEIVLATINKIMVFSLGGAKKGEWSVGNDVSMISMRIADVDEDSKKEIVVGYGWDETRLGAGIVKTGKLVVLEVTGEGAAETTTTTRKSDTSTTTRVTTEETTISKTTTTRYKPPQGTSTTRPDAGGGGFDLGMSGIIIIGVLGAGVLLLIVIAVVVLLFLKKKKKAESPPKEEKVDTIDIITSVKTQVDSPPKEEKKKAAEKK